METKLEPKFKVGDKITNGKGIFTIVTLSSDKYIVEDSFGRYGFLHFKNQDEWKILEEEDLDLKFKAGDRVFNKMTRKWVNIIEFDIETGLYIVRYDDGIQGRSLESELRFMEEKSKSHNNMCKQLIDEMIERKVGQVEKENQSREMLKENAKHYWEVITGGSKPKFKVGDRVLLALHPCVVNKVEWRGDSKYVGYVYTVRGTDFGKKVKEADLMLDPRKEETKSHNNMCKQLIDEMNPNVEVNVKTIPEPKFKRGDFVFSGIDFCAMKVIDRCYDEHWRYRIFDDVNEYWFFEKELKKVEIGDVVYSKVWKEKVIVRDFCDDKFILVADFNGKLLKSLPSLIKQIKEEIKPKPSNTVSVDKAAEVFADMLIELCPELLGFGGAAKEWENEFRKRLEE